MSVLDPRYVLLILPPLLLLSYARRRVRRAYRRYSQVPNRRGLSGRQVARAMLDANGLYEVPVELTPGQLTDHYDPRRRTLSLSAPVYDGRSVAALAIAAHETGHALQHQAGYVPLRVRAGLVPAASVGSNIGWIMVLAGIVIHLTSLAWLGVACFAAGALVALVTLPVEFNASSRALAMLTTMGIVDRTEYRQNREVLNAAALTYVAGFLAALMQLLYWQSVAGGIGRRRQIMDSPARPGGRPNRARRA